MSSQSDTESAQRVYLSPPHIGEDELQLVKEAFASNWIAPLGPHVNAFEAELANYVGVAHAAALASGTAALHLALRLLDIKPNDEVICPSLTFCASANPIIYEGAHPVFIDADRDNWNIDPQLLREELRQAAARNSLPRAVITVDLYGQCADYDAIEEMCAEYEVPIIEDAAEALGAMYKGHRAGTFGKLGIFSFNGNKIITTSGGGMLVSADESLIERAKFLATQARDPAPHYEHSVIGYNYRLSNVLAAIGRGQLRVLPERIAARKRNYQHYKISLSELPGLQFMPHAAYGEPNYWLTCIVIDEHAFGATREDVRLALEAENIESRPIWKPLHMQPAFAHCRMRGGAVSESVFKDGLCLPNGSNLSDDERQRIIHVIRRTRRRA